MAQVMYATPDNMLSRFGEDELIALTDRTGSGSIDSERLLSALSDAAATLNGYLAARYPLPLPTVPDVLTRLCCDIARYYLYDDAANDQVSKRHDDALKMLKQLSDGVVTLGLPDTQLPESSNLAQMQSAGSVWARSKSGGFI